MLDTIKRIAARKQTWATVAGVALAVPYFASGHYADGIKALAAVFVGQ